MILTPYRNNLFTSRIGGGVSLQSIVNNYNTLNAWSAENLNISGTTTTYLDYKGVHNLPNPSATNQATLTASNANFNNKATLGYVTDDYNYKAFSDYLIGENTGAVNLAFRTNTDVTSFSTIFASSEESANTKKFQVVVANGKIRVVIQNSAGAADRYQVETNTTAIAANTNYVVSIYQTGSALKILINSVVQSLTVLTGTASTFWFADVSGRFNIVIGATIQLSAGYSDFNDAFIQITSDSVDATVLANHNEIKTYYRI